MFAYAKMCPNERNNKIKTIVKVISPMSGKLPLLKNHIQAGNIYFSMTLCRIDINYIILPMTGRLPLLKVQVEAKSIYFFHNFLQDKN